MNGRGSTSSLAALACALGLTLGVAGPAAATSFSYQVERFEMDGNVRGAFDGTPDLVDDFNGSSVSPNWYRAFGTVSQHDGFLFLTDPGTVYPAPTGQPLELSIAASAYPYLQDGQGSFSGTAYWLPLLPPAGHHYHFSLFTFGSAPYFNETFGLGFLGLGDGNYAIEQHLTELNLAQGIYRNLISVSVPVLAADITGNLGMRLTFDDATNTVSSAFSLDGGATWQSPFTPASIFNGRPSAQFILSADPAADGTQTPTTTTTVVTTSTSTSTSTSLPTDACVPDGCRRGVVPGKGVLRIKAKGAGALTWKWARGETTSFAELGTPRTSTSYDLCIGDGNGASVYRAIIPPGTFWSQSGSQSYRFRDRGVFGIYSASLRAGASSKASAAIAAWLLYLPAGTQPLTLPVTVRLRSSDGVCWANVFSAPAVSNTPADFKALGD